MAQTIGRTLCQYCDRQTRGFIDRLLADIGGFIDWVLTDIEGFIDWVLADIRGFIYSGREDILAVHWRGILGALVIGLFLL